MVKTLIGLIVGVLVAVMVGASIWGFAVFGAAGALAGYLGAKRVGAVERFYWAMLGLLVALLGLAFMGLGVPGVVMMVPLVMALSRLLAMWIGGLIGRFVPSAA